MALFLSTDSNNRFWRQGFINSCQTKDEIVSPCSPLNVLTATPGFILYDGTGGIAVYLFPVPEVPPLPLIFYAVLHFFSSSRFNLLLALLVLLLLQLFCAYDFLYAEQFCFFRFSADYAASMLLPPGGAVEYAAQFLGQFYHYHQYYLLLAYNHHPSTSFL